MWSFSLLPLPLLLSLLLLLLLLLLVLLILYTTHTFSNHVYSLLGPATYSYKTFSHYITMVLYITTKEFFSKGRE